MAIRIETNPKERIALMDNLADLFQSGEPVLWIWNLEEKESLTIYKRIIDPQLQAYPDIQISLFPFEGASVKKVTGPEGFAVDVSLSNPVTTKLLQDTFESKLKTQFPSVSVDKRGENGIIVNGIPLVLFSFPIGAGFIFLSPGVFDLGNNITKEALLNIIISIVEEIENEKAS